MRNLTNIRLILAAAPLLALSAAGGVAVAQEVGKASAVNPAATTNARTIVIGESIVSKQRIQTQASGSVQLLFIDKTSMTIGPNSDLTIDEYVYDPKASTGKLAATLGKGAMRFVGGQVSHNGQAEIKTASAVIGIRGGLALISSTSVYTGYGQATVSSGGANVTLGVGEFTQTPGQGTPPTPPGPPPVGFVAALIQTFQSSGGQTGGAPAGTVTPARVAAAEARVTGSPTGTVAAVAPVVNGAVQVAAATTSNSTATTTQQNTVVNTVQQAAQTSTQSVATNQVAQEIIVERQRQQLQFGARPFALSSTNCCNPANPTSPVPFLAPSFVGNGTGYLSQFIGYRTASQDTVNRAPFFQFGVGILGVGAAQSSGGYIAQGAFIDDGQGGIAETGGFISTRRGGGALGVGQDIGAFSSTPGTVTLDADRLPSSATVTNSYLIPENGKYVANAPFLSLGDGSPSSTYNFTQNLTRIAPPEGLGVNRPAVTLSGFAGGLMRSFNTTTGQFSSPSFALAGSSNIILDPSGNRVQANFNVANVTMNPGDSFATGSFQYGSLDLFRSKGAYVDYDNFVARPATTLANPDTGAEAFVSTVNGQPLITNNGFFANITRSVAQQFASALSAVALNFCQCDLTRWGFWSATDTRTASNGNSIFDAGNLQTWVGGQLPNINEVPLTGVATYGGHVIASIKNGNNEYIAAGNLTNTVNFGSRTGTSIVSGLDGGYYSGALQLNANDPRQLGAVLTSQSRTLTLAGQLYRGTSSPVGEMGGNVLINGGAGSNYIGSGIFAASTTGVVATTQFAPQAFVMSMTRCCDSSQASLAPYLPAGFFPATGHTEISNVLGYRVGSQDNPAAAITLQYGINISGQGAAQSSAFLVATGAFSSDGAGGLVSSNGFFASRRGAANLSMGRANGTFSSPSGTVTLDANRLPQTASITNDYYVNESRTYVANPAISFPGGGGAVQNYTFTQSTALTASGAAAAAAGIGVNRPEVTLTGFTGGLMRTLNQDTNTFVAPSFATLGTATIALNPNNSRLQANFNIVNATPSTGDSFSAGQFQLGSTNTAQRSESAYIDYDNFGARRQLTVTNIQTGDTAPVSTVNGQTLINHNAALVNAAPAAAQRFSNDVGTNVNFCQCEYTRWGFWSNDSQRTSGSATVADRGNLMTWVAGRQTTIAEVPTTGTATYDGHVIASIKNGNNEYVAAGNLTNTVNFGTRTGAVMVTNLDNTNYSGTVAISPSDPRNFAAGLSGGAGGRSLALTGQFFRGVSSPVGEIGGSAILSGSNYIGSGIFAGKIR